MELTAVNRLLPHAHTFPDLGPDKLTTHFRGEIQEALRQAGHVIDRIMFLRGTCALKPTETPKMVQMLAD